MLTREQFLNKYPVVYHVTYECNVENIKTHGLFSANRVLKLNTTISSPSCRPTTSPIKTSKLGTIQLRDQQPMREALLERCLVDKLTCSDWYELINKKVFFWLSKDHAQNLVAAYQTTPHKILAFQTKALLDAHLADVYLSPINTGAVAPAYAKRGRSTFHSFNDWLEKGFFDRERKKQPKPKEFVLETEKILVPFEICQ